MAEPAVQLKPTAKGLGVECDSGFRMLRGICTIETSRGPSHPSPSKSRSGLRHELHVKQLSSRAVEFWQTVRNLLSEPLRINSLCMFDGELKLEGSGWRVAHSELFKRDCYFEGFNCYTDGLLSPIPGTEGEFGLAEDFPFPGIFFSHPERGTVLMTVLSQERCKPVWCLSQSGRQIRLAAREYFTGIPSLSVEGEGELTTERWVLIKTAGGIESALDEYYKLLRRRMRFPGTNSILRRAIVWGSWNYNRRPLRHMDITHDSILSNARALARLVPDRPRFVMIDLGYQRGLQTVAPKWYPTFLEMFHDDGTPPHQPERFPKGMKALADAIRKTGASPAIWATPQLHRESALAKAHPEWLLRLKGGKDFGPRTAFLDYSLPEVREYTRRAWHTVLNEWGYKAIKLDFWPIPFEIPYSNFRNRDRTAIELRNLFLHDLRSFIPDDGYILTGVPVNGGNPFVGRYVDATRCAQDIGDGNWPQVHESAAYLTAVTSFYRHDCLLADPDTIGWCPESTPGENRLWATMALMTGGMCEIGGDLTTLSPEARAFLEVATSFFGPAQRTSCGLDNLGLNSTPAPHLTLEREEGVYEAYLNWMASPREIRLPRKVRDLWTGKTHSGKVRIPPRNALWFKA